MDQQAQPVVNPSFPQYVMMPVRTRNGLGVAGFFIAFVGLFIPTGVIALLGLVVSLVALGRSPRGFAGAGVLLGLLGTVAWIAIMVAAILGFVVVAGTAAVAGIGMFVLVTQAEQLEVTSDMFNVAIATETYRKEHDAMPTSINDLDLAHPALHDPWGVPYRLVLIDDERGFDVLCAGEDGEFETDDDASLATLDRMWEKAFDNFGEQVEAFAENMERLDRGQQGNLLVQWEAECAKDPGSVYEQIARAQALAASIQEAHEAPRHHQDRE